MPVDAALWTRLAPLLDTLLALPADERAAALAALPDDDLRTAAVRLLERIEETGEDFLEADGGVLRHAEHLFLYAPTPPATLGPYRLLRELGRGGMGVVFLAERNDGAFEQQVAIKVLRFADPARAERLDRERHILAVLDHPAIARLRDGGHTPDGQPYLVLDYVDGTPLLDYARERPLPDRLRLLVDAADAVAYAHQHLIVHRDLKPSNLLVDPSGQVKLLDFGIAKVLTDDDTITRGDSPFTPAYAAPEQRRGEPVTTSTDVYALGALLHELATGLRLGGVPASTTMPSDVHAIVQRATEDAPADRYPSAAAFREDLLRYLSGQPIVARPPTFRYRATRFVQRNRLASVLAVLVAAALAVALAQGLRAQRALADAQTARDRAEATSGVLFTMLEGSDPTVAGGDTLSAHTLLERALAAQPNLNRFPDLRAQLLARIGTTLRRRGDWGRADTFLTAASQLTPDLDLSVESERAELARERSNFSDAEARYRLILDRTQQQSGPVSLAASFPMASLGSVLVDRNQPAEAETLLVRALAIRRQHLPTQDIRLVPVLSTLGSFYTDHRRYREAEPLLREAVSIFEAAPRDDHTLLTSPLNNLALLLRATDRLPEALSVAERSLALRRRLYGLRHIETANAMLTLGVLQMSNNQGDQGLATLNAALDVAHASGGEQHMVTAAIYNAIGFEHRSKNRFSQSVPAYQRSVRIYEQILGPSHPRTVSTLHNLARVHMAANHYADALPVLRECLRYAPAAYGTRPSPTHAAIYNSLGSTLYHLDRKPEALAPYQRSHEMYAAAYGETDARTIIARYSVGLTEMETGDPAAAVQTLHDNRPDRNGPRGWVYPLWMRTYGESLHLTDRSADALGPLQEAYAIFLEGNAAQQRNARGTAQTLADAYTRLGQPDQAALWAERARE